MESKAGSLMLTYLTTTLTPLRKNRTKVRNTKGRKSKNVEKERLLEWPRPNFPISRVLT